MRLISYLVVLLGCCLSTPSLAAPADESDRFSGLYLGLSMNSIDLGINSKIQNHDTVLFNSGGVQPSLFYRSTYRPLALPAFGYYLEYGLDSFVLHQGLVWNPGSSQDIDPNQRIRGWYGYVSPMLGYRNGGLTMAIGPALNFIHGNGGFAVSYMAPDSLGYESFSINKLAVSFRLLIEGETKHTVWGMRMMSVNHEDSRFNYQIGFITFYLGVRL